MYTVSLRYKNVSIIHFLQSTYDLSHTLHFDETAMSEHNCLKHTKCISRSTWCYCGPFTIKWD